MSLYDKVLEHLNAKTMQWYKANGYYTSKHRGLNARLKNFLEEQLEVFKRGQEPYLLKIFDSEFKGIFPESLETTFEGYVDYVNTILIDPVRMFVTNPQHGTLVVNIDEIEYGKHEVVKTHREYESFPVAHYNNDHIAEIINIMIKGGEGKADGN